MQFLNERHTLPVATGRPRRGSSGAGHKMGVSQLTAVQIVATREKQIGVTPLVRTTLAMTLTGAGSHYQSCIEPILTAIEEANHATRGTGELRGLLRVHATTYTAACTQRRWPIFRALLSYARVGAEPEAHVECRSALAVNSHSGKVVDRETHGGDRCQSLNPIPRRFKFSKLRVGEIGERLSRRLSGTAGRQDHVGLSAFHLPIGQDPHQQAAL